MEDVMSKVCNICGSEIPESSDYCILCDKIVSPISKEAYEKATKEGKQTDDVLASRARQNVIFEMGCFIGMLGRPNVFLLLEEGVEKPGDLDGIVYNSYDKKGAWRFDLVKEMMNCGYNVSADSLL